MFFMEMNLFSSIICEYFCHWRNWNFPEIRFDIVFAKFKNEGLSWYQIRWQNYEPSVPDSIEICSQRRGISNHSHPLGAVGQRPHLRLQRQRRASEAIDYFRFILSPGDINFELDKCSENGKSSLISILNSTELKPV